MFPKPLNCLFSENNMKFTSPHFTLPLIIVSALLFTAVSSGKTRSVKQMDGRTIMYREIPAPDGVHYKIAEIFDENGQLIFTAKCESSENSSTGDSASSSSACSVCAPEDLCDLNEISDDSIESNEDEQQELIRLSKYLIDISIKWNMEIRQNFEFPAADNYQHHTYGHRYLNAKESVQDDSLIIKFDSEELPPLQQKEEEEEYLSALENDDVEEDDESETEYHDALEMNIVEAKPGKKSRRKPKKTSASDKKRLTEEAKYRRLLKKSPSDKMIQRKRRSNVMYTIRIPNIINSGIGNICNLVNGAMECIRTRIPHAIIGFLKKVYDIYREYEVKKREAKEETQKKIFLNKFEMRVAVVLIRKAEKLESAIESLLMFLKSKDKEDLRPIANFYIHFHKMTDQLATIKTKALLPDATLKKLIHGKIEEIMVDATVLKSIYSFYITPRPRELANLSKYDLKCALKDHRVVPFWVPSIFHDLLKETLVKYKLVKVNDQMRYQLLDRDRKGKLKVAYYLK